MEALLKDDDIWDVVLFIGMCWFVVDMYAFVMLFLLEERAFFIGCESCVLRGAN